MAMLELRPAGRMRLHRAADPLMPTGAILETWPAEDAAIAALDRETRELVGGEWARRADVELTSASLTARLVQGLLLDGASTEVIELASKAVSDEARHARICHAV